MNNFLILLCNKNLIPQTSTPEHKMQKLGYNGRQAWHSAHGNNSSQCLAKTEDWKISKSKTNQELTYSDAETS